MIIILTFSACACTCAHLLTELTETMPSTGLVTTARQSFKPQNTAQKALEKAEAAKALKHALYLSSEHTFSVKKPLRKTGPAVS